MRRLADKLRRFYQQQARAGNSAVKTAAAKVEMARAERDPGRFMKRAQVAAQDESGLELPQELRSAFNCDLDGTPYGYGHGTWASWLLPVVWMQPPDQKYPEWFGKLPATLEKQAKSLYDYLLSAEDSQLNMDPRRRQEQERRQRRDNDVLTLFTFAWHGTDLIELLLDQADHLNRIKSNDKSSLHCKPQDILGESRCDFSTSQRYLVLAHRQQRACRG